MCQSHPTEPLLIWNYTIQTQYDRDWTSITRMCRGLVTDTDGNIIARPFQKFFNLNEQPYRYSDDHRIYEKMDGSLGIVFQYNRIWHIATRGSFTSDQAIKGSELLNNYDVSDLDPDYTYMFEIIYPDNRIVINYGEDRLTLIGKRHIENGRYMDVSNYTRNGFDVVKEYKDLSFSELEKLEWEDKEGFVVRFVHSDGTGDDFVKIKFDEYCRLHKIMTEVSTKSVWEMLKFGKDLDEVLNNVPDEFYDKIKDYERELVFNWVEIDRRYKFVFKQAQNLGLTNDRKIFAEYATTHEHPSILFKMLDGQDYEHLIWDIIRPEFKPL